MSSTSYITKSIINRQKRQIQVRRNILTLILSIFVIVSISFLSLSTKANDMEHEQSQKYYKSIEISKGDTLWSIANDNFDSAHYKNTREFVREIKKMNALTSDDIVAGNHIIIPYYSSEYESN